MRPNRQNKRNAIIVSSILLLALIGLFFVQTDYSAAERGFQSASQTSSSLDENTAGDLGGAPSVMPSLIRIISALVIVIGAIYGGLYLLKKMMGRKYSGVKQNSHLEVLETIHIAPKKTISLVRVGEKSVLVGATEASLSLLTELSQAATARILETTETAPAPESFGNLLKMAVDKVKEVTRKKSGAVIQHP